MRGVVLFKNTCWKRRTQRSRRSSCGRRLCLDASRPALVRANNSQGGSNRSEAGADQHLAQGRGTFGATGKAYAPRVRPQAASLRRFEPVSIFGSGNSGLLVRGAAFLSIRDLRFGGVMSDPLSVPFNCPNCGAKYEIVRVEAPPQWMADRDIKCVSCGGSLQGRHGMFVLKYFLVERPRRIRQKR